MALGLWLALSAFVQPQWRSGEDVATGLFIALASWWPHGPVTRHRGAIASWTVALLGCWAALAPGFLHDLRLTVWIVNDLEEIHNEITPPAKARLVNSANTTRRGSARLLASGGEARCGSSAQRGARLIEALWQSSVMPPVGSSAEPPREGN